MDAAASRRNRLLFDVLKARAVAAGFVALMLAFPAVGVWALLRALGRVGDADDLDTRAALLSIGAIFSAIGLWTGLVGVTALIRRLPSSLAPRLEKLVEKAWPAAGAAALAAAAGAAWTLRAELARDGHFATGAVMGGLLLAASAGFHLFATLSEAARRRHFGAAELALDTPACAPGEEVRARLTLGKRAAEVTAALERYSEDDDRPLQTVRAVVAGPEPVPGGFVYRVSAAMPAAPRPDPEEGGWVLAVKARGERGGTFEDDATVESRA